MLTGMEVQTVSGAAIFGMVVSLIISVGLPIAFLIIWRKKSGAKISTFFIGAVTFVIAALVLEQVFHFVIVKLTGNVLLDNIWLYAIYGGLVAGLFEETGRLAAMRLCMKKRLDKQNAIMYGIGHGGIEAILIAGLSGISNIISAILVNSGMLPTILESVGDAGQAEAAYTQLSALWTTPAYLFYMSGLERISAVLLHISLSYMVYLAVKNRKISWFISAIAIHALTDAGTILLAQVLPVLVVELILLALTGCMIYGVVMLYRKEQLHEE